MLKLALLLLVLLALSAAKKPIWSILGNQGVGNGYNIVSEQQTKPVVEFHYETDNVLFYDGKEYVVPDELYGFAPVTFTEDLRIFLMDSYSFFYEKYVSSWSVSAGATVDGVKLSGAFSHTQGQINTMLKSNINNWADNLYLWDIIELELYVDVANNSYPFQVSVDKLPAEYDYTNYYNFIQEWGTHVIINAAYGGSVNFSSVFNKAIYQTHDVQWVSNQVSLTLGWLAYNVGIKNSNFDNTTTIDKSFLEYAQNVTTVIGGDAEVFLTKGIKDWWKTVQTNMGVVFPAQQTQLLSIDQFVADPTKSANIRQAIITYANNSTHIP